MKTTRHSLSLLALLAVLLVLPGFARAVTTLTHYELTFDAMATGTTTGAALTAAATGATWSLHTGRGAAYTINGDAALTTDQAMKLDDPDTTGNGNEIVFATNTLTTPIVLNPATTVTISFRTAPTRTGGGKGLRFRVFDSSDVELGNVYWTNSTPGDVRLNNTVIGQLTFSGLGTWDSTSTNVRSVALTITSTNFGVNFGGVTGSASHARTNVGKIKIYSDGSSVQAKGLQLAELKFARTVSAPNAVSSGAVPANSATGVGVGLTALSWTAPAADATHDVSTNYIVYFGTNSTVTSNPSYTNATASLATPGLPLTANTTYYWRVDAQNEDGTTAGTSWQFTTGAGAVPIIDVAASTFPAAVTTTYGTASTSTSVAVSGSTLSADITATAPTGFEVSTNDSTWGATATFIQSGGNAGGTLYLRLKNNSPVAGSYNSTNVVLSSFGAPSTNVATTGSGNTVSPKALNVVSATAQDKMYDGTTAGTVLGNLDTAEAFGAGSSADGKPYTGDALAVSAPGTFDSSAVGTGISVTAGTFTLSGAAAGNYTVNQPSLSLSAAIRDTAVWTQLTGGTWATNNNWQNGVIGSGTGNTADFTTLTMTAARTVTMDGARTIGNLRFGDQSTNAFGWTLNSGTGGPLTLAVSSGTPAITNSVLTTITVQIAGSQGFTKTGSGTLRLNNTANSITNEILVSAGVLQMRDGSDNTPTVFAAATMAQRSLRITGPGVEELWRSSTGAETVTWALPATTLENGGTLRCRNGNDFAYTHNVDSALTIGTGGGVISSTGPTKNQTIALSGALSGSGALAFAAQDAASTFLRRLVISSANNTYSGDWTVSQTGAGLAYLRAGAANALGTGTVKLGIRAILENNAASGLDSLAGVTLNETSSTLDLSVNPWNNTNATLTAKNGTNNLGTATNNIGTFVLDSTNTVTLTAGSGGLLVATNYDIRRGTLTGSGSLAGTANLIKTTSGTATLAGTNTYTGNTVISDGALLVNGSLASGSAVTVDSGAKLGGTGTVGGTVTANGTIVPGNNGIGTLTLGAVPALNGVILAELNQNSAQTADKVVLSSGVLAYGGTLTVTNVNATLTNGTFTLFNSAGGYSGSFAAINLPPGGGAHWSTANLAVDGTISFANNNPAVSNLAMGAVSGMPATLKIISGKHAPTDLDGDALTVIAVSTPAHGTATCTDGTNVIYTASGSYSGGDSFTYTVSDGVGGTATATVTVTVAADGEGFNRISAAVNGSNDVLTYAGVPDLNYALDVTPSLAAPINWTPVMTNTADTTTGRLIYTNATPVGDHFYRTRYVP